MSVRHRTVRCVCGKILETCRCQGVKVKITQSPCRCARPDSGPRTLRRQNPLDGVFSETQYNERKRLGLPLATDIEKSASRRWD